MAGVSGVRHRASPSRGGVTSRLIAEIAGDSKLRGIIPEIFFPSRPSSSLGAGHRCARRCRDHRKHLRISRVALSRSLRGGPARQTPSNSPASPSGNKIEAAAASRNRETYHQHLLSAGLEKLIGAIAPVLTSISAQ